jgi:uncharacterized protein with FMN-binding domain
VSYRLVFHVKTVNTLAYTFKFDNVIVGPGLTDLISGLEEFTYQITSAAASNVINHTLSGRPEIVALTYYNGTLLTPEDPVSRVTSMTTSAITVDSLGLTFGSGQYLEVKCYNYPGFKNQVASVGTQFESGWIADTLTTTMPHYMNDIENIKSYEVLEWNVTANTVTVIDPRDLVTSFDNNNFYVDWTGITPSSTLKYKLVAGGKPLPQAIPMYIGGITKYVGFGTDSFPSLEACLPACGDGDVILVNRSYTATNTITVDKSNVKIVVQPGVVITSSVDNVAMKAFSVTGSNVIIENLSLACVGNLTDAFYTSGDDNYFSNVKVTVNGSGKTITDVFMVDTTADRTYLKGSVIVTIGTVTNYLNNLTTNSDVTIKY